MDSNRSLRSTTRKPKVDKKARASKTEQLGGSGSLLTNDNAEGDKISPPGSNCSKPEPKPSHKKAGRAMYAKGNAKKPQPPKPEASEEDQGLSNDAISTKPDCSTVEQSKAEHPAQSTSPVIDLCGQQVSDNGERSIEKIPEKQKGKPQRPTTLPIPPGNHDPYGMTDHSPSNSIPNSPVRHTSEPEGIRGMCETLSLEMESCEEGAHMSHTLPLDEALMKWISETNLATESASPEEASPEKATVPSEKVGIAENGIQQTNNNPLNTPSGGRHPCVNNSSENTPSPKGDLVISESENLDCETAAGNQTVHSSDNGEAVNAPTELIQPPVIVSSPNRPKVDKQSCVERPESTSSIELLEIFRKSGTTDFSSDGSQCLEQKPDEELDSRPSTPLTPLLHKQETYILPDSPVILPTSKPGKISGRAVDKLSRVTIQNPDGVVGAIGTTPKQNGPQAKVFASKDAAPVSIRSLEVAAEVVIDDKAHRWVESDWCFMDDVSDNEFETLRTGSEIDQASQGKTKPCLVPVEDHESRNALKPVTNLRSVDDGHMKNKTVSVADFTIDRSKAICSNPTADTTNGVREQNPRSGMRHFASQVGKTEKDNSTTPRKMQTRADTRLELSNKSKGKDLQSKETPSPVKPQIRQKEESESFTEGIFETETSIPARRKLELLQFRSLYPDLDEPAWTQMARVYDRVICDNYFNATGRPICLEQNEVWEGIAESRETDLAKARIALEKVLIARYPEMNRKTREDIMLLPPRMRAPTLKKYYEPDDPLPLSSIIDKLANQKATASHLAKLEAERRLSKIMPDSPERLKTVVEDHLLAAEANEGAKEQEQGIRSEYFVDADIEQGRIISIFGPTTPRRSTRAEGPRVIDEVKGCTGGPEVAIATPVTPLHRSKGYTNLNEIEQDSFRADASIQMENAKNTVSSALQMIEESVSSDQDLLREVQALKLQMMKRYDPMNLVNGIRISNTPLGPGTPTGRELLRLRTSVSHLDESVRNASSRPLRTSVNRAATPQQVTDDEVTSDSESESDGVGSESLGETQPSPEESPRSNTSKSESLLEEDQVTTKLDDMEWDPDLYYSRRLSKYYKRVYVTDRTAEDILNSSSDDIRETRNFTRQLNRHVSTYRRRMKRWVENWTDSLVDWYVSVYGPPSCEIRGEHHDVLQHHNSCFPHTYLKRFSDLDEQPRLMAQPPVVNIVDEPNLRGRVQNGSFIPEDSNSRAQLKPGSWGPHQCPQSQLSAGSWEERHQDQPTIFPQQSTGPWMNHRSLPPIERIFDAPLENRIPETPEQMSYERRVQVGLWDTVIPQIPGEPTFIRQSQATRCNEPACTRIHQPPMLISEAPIRARSTVSSAQEPIVNDPPTVALAATTTSNEVPIMSTKECPTPTRPQSATKPRILVYQEQPALPQTFDGTEPENLHTFFEQFEDYVTDYLALQNSDNWVRELSKFLSGSAKLFYQQLKSATPDIDYGTLKQEIKSMFGGQDRWDSASQTIIRPNELISEFAGRLREAVMKDLTSQNLSMKELDDKLKEMFVNQTRRDIAAQLRPHWRSPQLSYKGLCEMAIDLEKELNRTSEAQSIDCLGNNIAEVMTLVQKSSDRPKMDTKSQQQELKDKRDLYQMADFITSVLDNREDNPQWQPSDILEFRRKNECQTYPGAMMQQVRNILDQINLFRSADKQKEEDKALKFPPKKSQPKTKETLQSTNDQQEQPVKNQYGGSRKPKGKKYPPGNRASTNNPPLRSRPKDQGCYGCGELGHMVADCPKLGGQTGNSEPMDPPQTLQNDAMFNQVSWQQNDFYRGMQGNPWQNQYPSISGSVFRCNMNSLSDQSRGLVAVTQPSASKLSQKFPHGFREDQNVVSGNGRFCLEIPESKKPDAPETVNEVEQVEPNDLTTTRLPYSINQWDAARIYTRVQLNNLKVMALIDTGSTLSFLDTKWAKRYVAPSRILPSHIKFETTGDAIFRTQGRVFVDITVGGTKVHHCLYLVPNRDPATVIIGDKLLQALKATIHYPEHALTIKDVRVPTFSDKIFMPVTKIAHPNDTIGSTHSGPTVKLHEADVGQVIPPFSYQHVRICLDGFAMPPEYMDYMELLVLRLVPVREPSWEYGIVFQRAILDLDRYVAEGYFEVVAYNATPHDQEVEKYLHQIRFIWTDMSTTKHKRCTDYSDLEWLFETEHARAVLMRNLRTVEEETSLDSPPTSTKGHRVSENYTNTNRRIQLQTFLDVWCKHSFVDGALALTLAEKEHLDSQVDLDAFLMKRWSIFVSELRPTSARKRVVTEMGFVKGYFPALVTMVLKADKKFLHLDHTELGLMDKAPENPLPLPLCQPSYNPNDTDRDILKTVINLVHGFDLEIIRQVFKDHLLTPDNTMNFKFQTMPVAIGDGLSLINRTINYGLGDLAMYHPTGKSYKGTDNIVIVSKGFQKHFMDVGMIIHAIYAAGFTVDLRRSLFLEPGNVPTLPPLFRYPADRRSVYPDAPTPPYHDLPYTPKGPPMVASNLIDIAFKPACRSKNHTFAADCIQMYPHPNGPPTGKIKYCKYCEMFHLDCCDTHKSIDDKRCTGMTTTCSTERTEETASAKMDTESIQP